MTEFLAAYDGAQGKADCFENRSPLIQTDFLMKRNAPEGIAIVVLTGVDLPHPGLRKGAGFGGIIHRFRQAPGKSPGE
jgi:hypothetical protein